MGLLPHTEVDFEVRGNLVVLKKVKASQRRGRSLIEHMRGRADTGLSTDEIMALTRGDR